VSVAILDANGNLVTGATNSVSISALPAVGNPLPLGTLKAVNGVATFAALKINKAGSYKLQADAPSLLSATSAVFTLTPGRRRNWPSPASRPIRWPAPPSRRRW